ncbi:MAG TPA: trigger factor [Acidimicrobiia bacterium]
MSATVRDAGPYEKLVTLQISAEDLDAAMTRTARRLSGELKIKGFRPGKAPRKVVETQVGTARLRTEAIEDALPELVGRVLSETDLAPAVTPSLEKLEDVADGVEAEVRVTLWPVLRRPPRYLGREFEVNTPAVKEEELTAQIDRMRDQFAELEVTRRAAREGDFASVNISATLDGNPVPEATASDLLYEIGSRSFIEGLDEQLVSKAAGEIITFRSELPAGFGGLAGSRVTVRVLVKDVREKRLPELSDEWVSEMTEFETVEQLRAALKAQLERLKLASTAEQYRRTVVDELLSEVDLVVPDAILGAEMDAVLHRFVHQLESQDIEMSDYLAVTGLSQEQFLDDLRAQADRNIRTDLLLDAVSAAEGLEVSDSEFEAAARGLAARANEHGDRFLRRLRGTSREIALRGDILRRKALLAILQGAVPIDQNGSPIDLRLSGPEIGEAVEAEPDLAEEEVSA